jgi:creatinine amidohydrolase
MRWSELTSTEIADIDRAIPVVINIGAIEQHGPHLPLATDAMVGGHFLDRIDATLPDDVLIAPQVQVGCSLHHMDFAGTITVSHATMLAFVSDMLDSIYAHGFRNLVLFNSHGGNEAIGRVILEKWGAAHEDARIYLLTWWKSAHAALKALQRSGFGGVGHACEFETSLLMHFAPDAVRDSAISPPSLVPTFDWAENDMLNAPCGQMYRSMAEMSGGTGVVGDPSFACPETGKAISDAVSAQLIHMLRDIRAS